MRGEKRAKREKEEEEEKEREGEEEEGEGEGEGEGEVFTYNFKHAIVVVQIFTAFGYLHERFDGFRSCFWKIPANNFAKYPSTDLHMICMDVYKTNMIKGRDKQIDNDYDRWID